MEKIIKIPENEYEYLINKEKFCSLEKSKQEWLINKTLNRILNGVPLPKGHGRLKDVDWIDDNCENHYSDKDGSWCYTWKDINNAPTIVEADSTKK